MEIEVQVNFPEGEVSQKVPERTARNLAALITATAYATATGETQHIAVFVVGEELYFLWGKDSETGEGVTEANAIITISPNGTLRPSWGPPTPRRDPGPSPLLRRLLPERYQKDPEGEELTPAMLGMVEGGRKYREEREEKQRIVDSLPELTEGERDILGRVPPAREGSRRPASRRVDAPETDEPTPSDTAGIDDMERRGYR